jgi:hypothetical protein
MKKLLLALGLAALVSAPVGATVIIVSAPLVTANGPNWTWSYDVSLAPNSQINPPGTPCDNPGGGICDGLLTIYDFAGYVPATIATNAPGWTQGTVQFLGITPAGISPSDNGGLLNLSWAYVGNTSIAAPPGTSVFLGTFQADSIYDLRKFEDYAGRTSTVPSAQFPLGLRSANLDVTEVPDAVPEPTTSLLMGTALLGLALLRKRFGQK